MVTAKPNFPRLVTGFLVVLILVLTAGLIALSGQPAAPPAGPSNASGPSLSGSVPQDESGARTTPSPEPSATPSPTPSATPTPSPTPRPAVPEPLDIMEQGPLPEAVPFEGDGNTVTLLAGGDVLLHSYLLNGGLQADGSYSFDYMFRHLPRLTDRADIAYVNMEGTLGGPPYTGFPLFSAPDAVAGAIRSGGFDMATTANNHMIDRGTAGLIRTVDKLRQAGLMVTGTRRSLDEPYYQLADVGGIRICFATFTYETIRQEGKRGLNGLVIPEDAAGLINSFSLEDPWMTQDYARMGRLARMMREQGAEIVVFNLHWGTEYRTEEDYYQMGLAQVLADSGVDLIIGNGPHVIEPVKLVPSTDGSRQTLVYYSVGNLVTDQLYDTAGTNGYAEDGLLAKVTFSRQADGSMAISRAGYIASYCYKIKDGPKSTKNTIVPIEAALQDLAGFEAEEASALLEASRARIQTTMAKNDTPGLTIENMTGLEG